MSEVADLPLPIVVDLNTENDFAAFLNQEKVRRNYWFHRTGSHMTERENADPLLNFPTVLAEQVSSDSVEVVIERDGAVARCSFAERGDGNSIWASVIAGSREAREAMWEWVVEQFPIRPPADTKIELDVGFWVNTGHGPSLNYRRLAAPHWPEIERNYPAAVHDALAHLMEHDQERTQDAGRLVLWHGEPGTGKTWALRALAQAWLPWCTVQYVVDPDRLFGNASDYLYAVLMDNSVPDSVRIAAPQLVPNGEGEPPVAIKMRVRPQDRWRVLVLEDTGELLSNDARERAGQGLSRLLNVADGFLGQGIRLMVLITTNEDPGKLHEAVIRAGRCLAKVEFNSFTPAEARRWLQAHGIERPEVPRSNITLADMYAILADRREQMRERPKVGFQGLVGQRDLERAALVTAGRGSSADL